MARRKNVAGARNDSWYKHSMALTFLPDGTLMRYEHESACTPEERRFGTCQCSAAAIKRHEALRVAAQAPDRQLDQAELTQAKQQPELIRARMLQRQVTATCHDRLRILRIATGWSQGELARQLGISRRSVIRYEKIQHRHPPRLSVLLRLQQLEADYKQQLLAHFSRG
jgi:DNA-binding XRE family transcriptional regulator